MATSQPQDHYLKLQPRQRSRRWVIASAALAGITVVPTGLAWAFGPGGYLGENARKLRALENDPMGAETILGHTAFHTDRARLPGWFEPKYSGVYLERYFHPTRELATLIPEFIGYAKSHGWEDDPRSTGSEDWHARHSHKIANDYMHLTIATTDEHSHTAPVLRGSILIALDYH